MDTGGGGTVGSQFDDAGRITVSNPGAEHEETFTYDNNGNLTSITAPSLPYHNRVYNYDALDRLEHAEGPWGIIDYTYDDVGNRQTKTVDGVTETYAYVTGTNIIESVTNGESTNYIHDANGNITGINNKILIYNQNNRLIRVEEDSATLGEYTYNGLGQRIIKEADGNTTIFHYDFDGNIIGESDATGTFSKEYLYRGSNRLALVDYSTESNGEIYFFGNDMLGTPLILTDTTNTVVWEAIYKPFGEAEANPNSTVKCNFRFKGQYYDSETGFHYNYHRYYDPSTGRYLRSDSIGLAGGINLFAYSGNNPINGIDPNGLEFLIIGKGDFFLLGKTPWFYRISILRKFSRIPFPKGLPKETPVNPKRFFPERSPDFHRDLGGPPDDLWWQQDPFPRTLKPYNPNKPIIPYSIKNESIHSKPKACDPCEGTKKDKIRWEEIPEWMKA